MRETKPVVEELSKDSGVVMRGEEKDNNQAERIVEFSEALMGDIDQTDDCEAEEIYQEFGQGKNLASAIMDLAAKAAQKYRLANRAVPLHVQLALDASVADLIKGSAAPQEPR
jgi:hypothetical protein